jgi:hypothetical protein
MRIVEIYPGGSRDIFAALKIPICWSQTDVCGKDLLTSLISFQAKKDI